LGKRKSVANLELYVKNNLTFMRHALYLLLGGVK